MSPGKTDYAYLRALEEGERFYVPSKPCKAGHRWKYTASRRCVECQREQREALEEIRKSKLNIPLTRYLNYAFNYARLNQ